MLLQGQAQTCDAASYTVIEVREPLVQPGPKVLNIMQSIHWPGGPPFLPVIHGTLIHALTGYHASGLSQDRPVVKERTSYILQARMSSCPLTSFAHRQPTDSPAWSLRGAACSITR